MTITLDFCRLPDHSQPLFDYILHFIQLELLARIATVVIGYTGSLL